MDLAKAWETYKAAWSRGKALAMDAKTFNELFVNGVMASECINLLNGSHGAAVRATLMAVASQPSEELVSGLSDRDRWRVWWELLKGDPNVDHERMLLGQRRMLSASTRRRFVWMFASPSCRTGWRSDKDRATFGLFPGVPFAPSDWHLAGGSTYSQSHRLASGG